MKKPLSLLLCLALALSLLAGCRSAGPAPSGAEDQALADAVTAQIDALRVQTYTPDTDARCAAAKDAWDQLTEAQKALVEDPDYFGLDTGDASRDDPRNQDGIGPREILVVSFGTSFNDSRAKDIGGIEQALQTAYPDWSVRRAFTSQIILNHVQARDGEQMDNVRQALDRAAANGVETLVIQPTHLMQGAEYDELLDTLAEYQDRFAAVAVARPLLGEVGADAAALNPDKQAVARAATQAAVEQAGYASLEAARADGAAFVLLGHGTSHTAKVSYAQMQTQLEQLGYENVFIGTVEGEPEQTACAAVLDAVAQAGYTKLILRPLMVVAGDHAHNDMAGPEEDSWASQAQAGGRFSSVEAQMSGLGRVEEIQQLYVEHTAGAMEQLTGAGSSGPAPVSALEDGVYSARFDTDSGMFHANEACEGRGTLTVREGEMTLHVSLASQKIRNLYPGKAADAPSAGEKVLQPTLDTVTYPDGTTEEVYGFDVPVPALDTEFDLALVGTKGTWYDHRVSVSDPVPVD